MKRLLAIGAAWTAVAVGAAGAAPARGQNVVADRPGGPTAETVSLTAEDVAALLAQTPDFAARADSAEAQRVRQKLDRHVAELVRGFPWKAFHNTLGISGYETYFDHPDELFHALSIALPQLEAATAGRAAELLKDLAERHPPYAVEGFDRAAGRPRERYDVPEDVRATGRGRARSALGVYAFWAYAYWTGDAEAAAAKWADAKDRVRPLLEKPYAFDVARTDYAHDEAEVLNGDLAGLVGLVRLARRAGDKETEAKALERAAQVLGLRVNLERTNPTILEKTHSAGKTLHAVKPARYCGLVPEAARAVRDGSSGLAAGRLRAFREERNGWYLAFGERMIGGENYVSPPHMGRAMFAGAALIEDLPAEEMLARVDVPWCKADLYFIEKCAYALWAAAGRPWKSVP